MESTATDVPDAAAPTRRRVLRRALLGAGLVVVLLAAWIGVRVWQAVDALREARATLRTFDLDGSWRGLGDDVARLQDATSRASSAAADPLWRAAEVLPWAGDHLTAVRVVAGSLDTVLDAVGPASGGLERLLDGGLRRDDGGYDVAALRGLATQLGDAADRVADARRDVAALDPDALVGPLAGPVRQVQEAVGRVDAALGPAGRVAGALPAMLGADGPRTYLVLALNTAELRATGGIIGTVVAVRVDDGNLSVVDVRSTADLPAADGPVLPLTDAELATWGERLGRWVQNAVLTPDFPRAAELVAARWTRSVGGTVDGVVATDPVAVAGFVRATGPVPDPDGGEIPADRLVDVLLRESYLRYPDPLEADAFFGRVAQNLVAAVVAGGGQAQDLLTAGRRAVDERRLRVWSAHPQEQEVLAGTTAGGAFVSPMFADQPGLFLDDTTQGKLGAYLTTSVEFRDARCEAPAPTVRAVLRLDHRPPPGIETWSPFITGAHDPDDEPGVLSTTVSAWSAQGDPPPVVTRDGAPVTGDVSRVEGRTVLQVGSRLRPGESDEITVELPLRDGAVTLWTTPTLTSPGVATFRCG